MIDDNKKDQKTKKEGEPQGLCSNCINFKYCSYAKRAVKPVLFCEEYDIYHRLAEKYDLGIKKGPEEKKSKK